MKYYMATIKHHNGCFEYDQSVMFATVKDADERHEEITQGWYGIDLDEEEEEEGVYWNDGTTYQTGDLYQISKKCFEELKKKHVFYAYYDGDC